MAKYLLLIYGEEPPAPPTPAQVEAMFTEYDAFSVGIEKQGILRGAEALLPTAAATTARSITSRKCPRTTPRPGGCAP